MKISFKEILDNIPEGLSDIEIVRYIYLKTGEKFSYLREYLYVTDSRVSKDIYEDYITMDMIENGNYENKIRAICNQIAEVVIEVINRIPREKTKERISARTVGKRDDEENHLAMTVQIGEKYYYIDLYRDLYKIQKGMKTNNFALSKEKLEKVKNEKKSIKEDIEGIEFESLSEEELERMDTKLGYTMNGLYMDDAIETLREEMSKEESWKEYMKDYESQIVAGQKNGKTKEDIITKWKIDFIFRYLKNNYLEQDEMGMVELNKYYKKIYSKLLTKEEIEKNKLKNIDIHIDGKESIIYVIENKDKNQKYYYIYDIDEKRFVEILPKDIKEMEENKKLTYDSEYARLKFPEEEEK